MDLVKECSVLEPVEDNDQIRIPACEKLGNMDESKVANNGPCAVETDCNQSSFPVEKLEVAEVLGSVNSPPVGLKPEVSPSTTTKAKGTGLRKWRRIKRDFSKGGESSINAGKMATNDLSNSVANPSSKRVQVFAETNQQSQGSASSTNTVVRGLDAFALLDGLGLGISPSFAAGTDSENSEDRSSKSSTAASAPKMKYDMPVGPQDKSRMRNLSGKNLIHSVQRGSQGNGRVETTKKARGERVKIEKENSHSSVESDLRSSNFVFMQGTCSRDNGIQSGRPKDYDGENGDEVQGSEQVSQEHIGGFGTDGEGGYEDRSPEDVVADSPWELKEEKSENRGSSADEDPLVEYILALQSAQEALETEVLKFKEISTDLPADDSVSDLCTEFIDVEQKLQGTSSERSPYSEGLQGLSRGVQSEVVETANGDVETGLEDLFKQKIEVEVEYLAISRAVQKLRVAAGDQITVMADHKALVSEQTEILDKLEDTKTKAAMLKKEAEKLEHFCGDIASADETLKLQKRVFKYSSCFFVQLVLLVATLGIFFFQLSLDHVDVIPT